MSLPASTFNQEVANGVSHGLGVLLGVVALPILMAAALQTGHLSNIIGAGIFSLSLLMVYTFSTLYHSFQHPKLKRIFKTLDHISIYFLIAGSYTPFILGYHANTSGIVFLSVMWTLVLAGTIFKIFFTGKLHYISTFIYLGMGWMIVFIAKPLFLALPSVCLTWIAIGGGFYTFGVIFYLWEKLPYNHMIWHFFVLFGSISHYIAIFYSVTALQ